jgi:hypothetical protein
VLEYVLLFLVFSDFTLFNLMHTPTPQQDPCSSQSCTASTGRCIFGQLPFH